jgi:hypothetical protein
MQPAPVLPVKWSKDSAIKFVRQNANFEVNRVYEHSILYRVMIISQRRVAGNKGAL